MHYYWRKYSSYPIINYKNDYGNQARGICECLHIRFIKTIKFRKGNNSFHIIIYRYFSIYASKKGVLRGLHFQINYPQDKLVRVVNGEVFDVAVDLREGSKTYGKWFGVLLSAENKKQFFIPKNFAHGFIVLSDYAEFAYKCTDFYHPNDEGGLYFDDPEIGVEWPMPEGMTKEDLIISEKDHKWGGIKDLKK